MKHLFLALSCLTFLFSTSLAPAQQYTQTLRGRVIDVETRGAIPGVIIQLTQVLTDSAVATTTTNAQGEYLFEAIPAGLVRITARAGFYEPLVREDIMVTSAKEAVVNLSLSPSPVDLEAVEVKGNPVRGQALNPLATNSAVTLTVEETRKFAGSWDDPMRVITAYPGVVQQTSGFNDFTVRGNGPAGLLYRLEGLPIPSPNHFNSNGRGGFVTQFSAEVLSFSDFFSGAFPAEFGNATAGVFDFRFRNGNSERREHTVKASVFGFDVATEGPLSANSKASYLVNYRYSTLGILASFINVGGVRPAYQDLSFNVQVPTSSGGTLKIFGVGGLSNYLIEAEEDSSLWAEGGRRVENSFGANSGSLGLAYYQPTAKGYWHVAAAGSAGEYFNRFRHIDDDLGYSPRDVSDYFETRLTATADYNHRFSKRHTNKTGIVYSYLNHRYLGARYNVAVDGLDTLANTTGALPHIQAFSQSKFILSEKWLFTVGLNYMRLQLSGQQSLSPRAGLSFQPSRNQTLALSYGHHARHEHASVYYQFPGNGEAGPTNKTLALFKTHHGVLSYTNMLSPSLKLRTEAYYQYAYDVPAAPNGPYSVQTLALNELPNGALENVGNGRNYGLEVLLHQFSRKGLYYMLSGSIFSAEYRGGDGVWHNTRFNQGFSYNILVGKEFARKPKKDKQRILGLNANFRHTGGTWYTPIDLEQSRVVGWTVNDWTAPFTERNPNLYNLDFTLTRQVIRPRVSADFYVSIKNLYSNRAIVNRFYDLDTDTIEETLDYTVIPIVGYKLSF